MIKRVLAGVLAILLVLPCFSVMAKETGWTEETEYRLKILSALQKETSFQKWDRNISAKIDNFFDKLFG